MANSDANSKNIVIIKCPMKDKPKTDLSTTEARIHAFTSSNIIQDDGPLGIESFIAAEGVQIPF